MEIFQLNKNLFFYYADTFAGDIVTLVLTLLLFLVSVLLCSAILSQVHAFLVKYFDCYNIVNAKPAGKSSFDCTMADLSANYYRY